MIKTIRKTLSLFLIVCMIALSTVNCIGEIDVVKSYYHLKYEYKSFLDPLTNAGATESNLISFFEDVEELLLTYEDLSEETIQGYLEDVLITVATFREHRSLAAIISDCYSDEIDSYAETGIIPPNLRDVYEAVVRSFFGDKNLDKTELVKKYEEYLEFVNSNRYSYTDASVNNLEISLNAALNVLSNKNATQDSITTAVNSLNTAYSALAPKPSVPSGGTTGGTTGGVVSGGTTGGSVGGSSGASGGGNASVNIPDSSQNRTFSDITDAYWGKTAIMYLYEKKIINGFEDGTFRPEELVTREQFAKMIFGALNLPKASKTYVYSDVMPGSWYEEYVFAVNESGLMKGIGNEKFGTGLTLIRQDLAVIADRIITEGFLQKKFENVGSSGAFSDINTVSEYAKDSVIKMQKLGVVNGTGGNNFTPSGGVTRAQAAQIIYNLIK